MASNVEMAKRIWELFNLLNPDPEIRNASPEAAEMLECFDPEIEFTQPPLQPDAQTYRGRDAFWAAWDEWLTLWGEHRSEIVEIAERGDRVLVLSHDDFVARDGLRVEMTGGTIVTFGRGRVVKMRAFFDHDEAREAFEAEDASHST